MAKASKEQTHRLLELQKVVIEHMRELYRFEEQRLEYLFSVPLGVLRKNATQRHGVTRWRQHLSHIEIESVDLHPELLGKEWYEYAKFVLFHEYLHAIGFKEHDAVFRHLESRWPIEHHRSIGRQFTTFLQQKNASWKWMCTRCNLCVYRKKPTRGKFMCKKCNVVLIDEHISS